MPNRSVLSSYLIWQQPWSQLITPSSLSTLVTWLPGPHTHPVSFSPLWLLLCSLLCWVLSIPNLLVSEWLRAHALDFFSSYTHFLGDLIQAYGFKFCGVQPPRWPQRMQIICRMDEKLTGSSTAPQHWAFVLQLSGISEVSRATTGLQKNPGKQTLSE